MVRVVQHTQIRCQNNWDSAENNNCPAGFARIPELVLEILTPIYKLYFIYSHTSLIQISNILNSCGKMQLQDNEVKFLPLNFHILLFIQHHTVWDNFMTTAAYYCHI